MEKFRKGNPNDPRLLFLDTQQEILDRLARNDYFQNRPNEAEWLSRVLKVFMASLQNAMEGRIAPSKQVDEMGNLLNEREFYDGMIDFINGRKGHFAWRDAFSHGKIGSNLLNAKNITSPTSAEVYALLMAHAHIRYDLYMALVLEGVGTDEAYAEIGKDVLASMQKFQHLHEGFQKLGTWFLPWFNVDIDIAKLRDQMRQNAIAMIKDNLNVDPLLNPCQGHKTGVLDSYPK